MENTVIFTISQIGTNKYSIMTKDKRWVNHNRMCVARLNVFPEMTEITTFFNSVDTAVLFEVD